LLLGAYFGGGRARTRESQLVTVHPFASDRAQFYRFSGGDTITTLRVGDRAIPVARVRVTPHSGGPGRLGLFDGEIDLDASRHQIVRMRGQFVILGPPRSGRSVLSRLPGITAVAYGEFVNAEIGGRYWLPAFQRTEFQASVALLGQTRSVFRLVSRFDDYQVDDSSTGTARLQGRPGLVVTYGPQDSISRFGDWRRGLGIATASVSASDFDDVGPDEWRPVGPPRLDLAPTKTSEMLRYNRVEGLFTGAIATVQFRDLFPGLSVGVFGGWAWTEGTARGGARASLARGSWILGARAEAELASTNDFALPLDEGAGVGALLAGLDDIDYVDRHTASISATRSLGGFDAVLATVQFGLGSDRAEIARVEHGLFGGGRFRPNRGIAEGTYALATAEVEVHPNVTGDFVQPGVGARLRYEAGAGDLRWNRAEVALSGRRYWGPFQFSAHADAGALLGRDPPPQKLFELGGNEALPGYSYKEFVGDRAALFRAFASYRFPLWRSPINVFRRFYLPGFGPGLAVGMQGGWAELSSDAARRAVAALGTSTTGEPVSRATDGVRATVGGGITVFSDVLHFGVARPIDRPAPWRFVFGFGQTF
jgi:hypothetical protein